MNQRIQELANKAGAEVKIIHGDMLYISKAGLNIEKFAELIVRECVDIALEQKKWVEDMETLNLHDEIWNRARIQQSQHIVDKIKEHFGVEK